MPATCFHCGKSSLYGRSHTHRRGVAGGRWKKRAQKTLRVFKANLQKATITDSGMTKQVRFCAKCIKRMKKDTLDGKKPFYQLIHVAPIPQSPLPQPITQQIPPKEEKITPPSTKKTKKVKEIKKSAKKASPAKKVTSKKTS